jgi:restriction endonuclease S subunit
MGMLTDYLLPLPPLDVQNQIVADLDSFSEIVIGAKQIVDNWKPKVEVDQSWPRVKIGDICKLHTGGTPSSSNKSFYGGDIPWLVSGDIHKGEIWDCAGRITKLGMESSNARILPMNSVLVALNGQGKTRGTVALLRIEATCNQSLVAIEVLRDDLLPEFLYYTLSGMYRQIRAINGENERGGLNMPLIREIEVPIPSLELQISIVSGFNFEKEYVGSAVKLIEVYESKIRRTIAQLWNEPGEME